MPPINGPAQTALANVFLARIPLAERKHAIRDLAAQVDVDTLSLVAVLTADVSDPEADESLRQYLVRDIERDDAVAAASVCVQHTRLREALFERAGRELDVALALLFRRPNNGGLAVPVSDLDYINLSFGGLTLEPYHDRNLEDIVHFAVVYLNFFKQIFRLSSRERSFTVSRGTLDTIFSLLAATDDNIASGARDACFAFLAAFETEALVLVKSRSDLPTLDCHIWQCVDSLLAHTTGHYRTTAYAIWLRWLDNSGSLEDAKQTDVYWSHILHALASGDVEQRKTCLHILRTSVATSRKPISTKDMQYVPTERRNDPESVQAHYERFCTVYETIVIGRYFNQAEECMRDLDALASSRTKVQESWLFALLEPAMSTVTQDSIRKMLGNWLMSTDIKVSTHIKELTHFLEKSFLPWVCVGQLFTGSLRGRTRDMQCEHGIRLANFVERLIDNHAADHQVEVRRSITQSILQYLYLNKTRVIPYAIIYILHGLARGLKGLALPCMGDAELKILVDLPTGTPYAEITQDLISTCCWELSQLAVQGQRKTGDLRLELLAQKVQNIRLVSNPAAQTALLRWKTLQQYLDELHASRHASLSGEALPAACRSLIMLFETLEAEALDSDLLSQVLDSIWSQLEIQDFHKNTLSLMPSLILHPRVVEAALLSDDLADMLAVYISQLHQFCAGRIYLWTPLMSATRIALINQPAAAGKLDVASLIVETANRPPSAKVEFQLEAAVVPLLQEDRIGRKYSYYYGEYEEQGYAAFFDLVNRLPSLDAEFSREIYDRLIEPWIGQKLPVSIINKWKTTTQLQIMVILQEQLLPPMTQSQARNHMDTLHKILAVEPLPRHRLLLEWQIARTIIRHPKIDDDVLLRLSTMDHHSNPKYLSSLAKIGLMIACMEDCKEDFAERLACRLVALSSSSKIIIRHEAQWSFPILWNSVESRGWTSITENPACRALNEYIRSLERFSTPPTERLLESLDPVAEHNLANLLSGPFLRLEPPTAELVTPKDIQRMLDHDLKSTKLPQPLPIGSLPFGDLTMSGTSTTIGSLRTQATQQESKVSARTSAAAALQTKGTAYLSASSTKSEDSARPTDLLVVASLVDNAYNLGGLSRIAEIFGASGLYMNKPKAVLANKDFISVAVASQNHLPIHELAVENLRAFLTEKKMQGYSVVGVEQTDRSVILGDEFTKLPEKTLLVMGAEKEGIPAVVLGECDILVEIPQRGVTRSMNVQTAAGVVLYEYSRQHRGK